MKLIDWRLKKLGIEENFQLPLILPKSYKDYSSPSLLHDSLIGKPIMTLAYLTSPPMFSKQKRMLKFKFKDHRNVKATAITFSNSYSLYKQLAALYESGQKKLFIYGNLDKFEIFYQLRNVELVDSTKLKQVIPVYPNIEKIINSSKVSEKIASFDRLHGFNTTSKALIKKYKLDAITSASELDRLLSSIHFPVCIKEAEASIDRLKKIAVNAAIYKHRQANNPVGKRIDINPIVVKKLKALLPFSLTEEQEVIIDSIVSKLQQGYKLNDIISGDVGTGKTICYALPLAAIAISGGNAGVILPTETLARQIYQNFTNLFPNLNVNLIEKNKKITDSTLNINGRVNIGTTVVLNSDKLFFKGTDCWVVDEEHKFGTDIKEHPSLIKGHYIGATATCIPRTQQLLFFGQYDVHRLKTCHVDKNIITRIIEPQNSQALLNEIEQTLRSKQKVIIVYPVAELADESNSSIARYNSEVTSVESAYHQWEKVFPDQVAYLHGKMKPERKINQIDSFKKNKKSILISTTAIEVGFDDPNVYRVVVIHPEVHGLAGLHQIRGRLVRNGGTGYFDLFAPGKLSNKSRERLNALISKTDGFELASLDLKQRGFGDLAKFGKEQSGAIKSFLLNHKIEYYDFEKEVQLANESVRDINDLQCSSIGLKGNL